jgi:hypothetical protein
VHTVHIYWRKFDDRFMRPIFGGPRAHWLLPLLLWNSWRSTNWSITNLVCSVSKKTITELGEIM